MQAARAAQLLHCNQRLYQGFCGGASKNRTCDLILIRVPVLPEEPSTVPCASVGAAGRPPQRATALVTRLVTSADDPEPEIASDLVPPQGLEP
jgi:hypothetical protein